MLPRYARGVSEVTLPKLSWRVVYNRAVPPDRGGWGRVRAAQINELSRAVTIAWWGQTLYAILLAFILRGQVDPVVMTSWLFSLAIVMAIAARELGTLRKRNLLSITRKGVDRTSYYSVILGLLWTVPASYFAVDATHVQQLAICLITASMMAGAAFVFTPVPPAAFGYVVVMGAAVTNMLWVLAASPIVTAIGPIYTFGLAMMLLSHGRAFMQRKCVEIALEERSETVSLLLREYESSDADWLWQTNGNLVFQNVSARFARAIGRSVAELESMSILDLLEETVRSDPGAARSIDGIMQNFRNEQSITDVVVPIAAEGMQRCVELSARPRYNRQGRFVGYRGVGSDVTEARQASDRIAHIARHDALTGLPNRLQLLEALGEAFDDASANDGGCAILLIDLDRFKTINDSLGHIAGDHLLQQVSARFDAILSPEMTPGRLGGDEFAIVIPNAENRQQIERLCLQIIEAMQRPFVYNDQHLFVGASIGVAVGPEDGRSVEELIRNADLALYRAKDDGGDEIRFYEPGLHAKAEERRRIELQMRAALDRGELSLVYQPVVRTGTHEIDNFEALLRWTNEELGEVSPAKFVPIAEETGLITRIGEWVLRTACADASGWPEHVAVAVNISPRQLQDPAFVLTLISALSQSNLDPHRLELEITETLFLNLSPNTEKVLQQIRSLGVRLAMDDFGTGYSSLGYLLTTNFDTLKIDRGFVKGISRADPESAAIIRAVVAMAGSLGMTTVAEGVETQEQLDLVSELGCDRIQGFFFSDPLRSEAARELIERSSDGVRAAA